MAEANRSDLQHHAAEIGTSVDGCRLPECSTTTEIRRQRYLRHCPQPWLQRPPALTPACWAGMASAKAVFRAAWQAIVESDALLGAWPCSEVDRPDGGPHRSGEPQRMLLARHAELVDFAGVQLRRALPQSCKFGCLCPVAHKMITLVRCDWLSTADSANIKIPKPKFDFGFRKMGQVKSVQAGLRQRHKLTRRGAPCSVSSPELLKCGCTLRPAGY